jgi:hypothetical protein
MTEEMKIPDGYTEEDFVYMDNPNGHPDRIRAREEENRGSVKMIRGKKECGELQEQLKKDFPDKKVIKL